MSEVSEPGTPLFTYLLCGTVSFMGLATREPSNTKRSVCAKKTPCELRVLGSTVACAWFGRARCEAGAPLLWVGMSLLHGS